METLNDPLRLKASNGVGVGVAGVDITKPIGEATLTVMPKIDLYDSAPDSAGLLEAESTNNPQSELATVSWDLGRFVSPMFTEQTLSLGPAELTITPLSFLGGPRIFAGQSVSVKPGTSITYHFDRPLDVQLGSAGLLCN